MSRRIRLPLPVLILVCLLVMPVLLGQAGRTIGTSGSQEMRARVIGALTHTYLAADFDNVPAREVFRSVSEAIGVPIVGRYRDDQVDHGINPESPIFLRVERASARFVLEMILEQCAVYEPCSWQIRLGYIEVGTKERLSTPAAAEIRIYNLRDLMIEAPYFSSGIGFEQVESVGDFDERPYATAALTRPVEVVPQQHGRGLRIGPLALAPATARKRAEQLILEIAGGIVETVEPGNWDYGQSEAPPNQNEEADPDGPGGNPMGAADQATARPGINKIARLRIWRDTLIITAPDFIHRQVAGYPPPIVPAPLSAEERVERSNRASAHGGRVIVLDTMGDARQGP